VSDDKLHYFSIVTIPYAIFLEDVLVLYIVVLYIKKKFFSDDI